MITRAQKSEEIARLSESFSRAKAAFLIDFKGLNVEKVSDFRKKLRGINAEMKVARNTLALQALNALPESKEALKDFFVGCTAMIFAYDDVSAPAKSLKEFSDVAEELVIKGGVMDGKRLGEEQVRYLASLPGKPELQAKLLGTMQAPMAGFVRLLNGVPSGFARLLAARKSALEQQT